MEIGFSAVFANGNFLAYLGVAVAVFLSSIGSARGVGIVGEAASGLLSENPDLFGQVVVLQALPGTQGIYGFLIGVMIMLRTGMMGGAVELSLGSGAYILAAALPIGIVGLFSAIYQGRVAAAGISLIAKKPDEIAKGIVMAAMVETYAILAFLISMLLVLNIPV